MKRCRIFHNEQELSQELGEFFLHPWKILLKEYKKRNVKGLLPLKLASLAFVFYQAAVDENLEIVNAFDEIIRGDSRYPLSINGEMVHIEDEKLASFVWDTAALMIESDIELPGKTQEAFDVAGNHVWLAYKISFSGVQKHNTVVVTNVKKVNEAVPEFTDEQIRYMLDIGKKNADSNFASSIERLIVTNIMERYHSETLDMINDMKEHIRKSQNQQPLIGSYHAKGSLNIEHIDQVDNLTDREEYEKRRNG